MNIVELRQYEQARTFLLQGLWLQRMTRLTDQEVKPALECAHQVAASEHSLPPIGFVSDLGHHLFDTQTPQRFENQPSDLTGLPPGLLRAYEDHVLGKIATDFTLERAVDALGQYKHGDRAKALTFIIQQFHQRSGFQTVSLSPAVIKGLMREQPSQLVAEGWESITRDGVMPVLVECYASLIKAVRNMAEILGPEDIFELEHGTAISEFGQRVALRQVLSAIDFFERSLPYHRPQPLANKCDVPTHILDEDTYPVGGFSSLSNRGSIESLLHSQLAFMEKKDRPDLFDIKFLRDELLYYSRDENQFFRRRRSFVFVLYPDLVHARFKDAGLTWQRIILALGFLVVTIRKLCEWLSEDALLFEILFIEPKKDEAPLAEEKNLLETILREQIANGTVVIDRVTTARAAASRCAQLGRRSLCHCLTLAAEGHSIEVDNSTVTGCTLAEAKPQLKFDDAVDIPLTDDPMEQWQISLDCLLRQWI